MNLMEKIGTAITGISMVCFSFCVLYGGIQNHKASEYFRQAKVLREYSAKPNLVKLNELDSKSKEHFSKWEKYANIAAISIIPMGIGGALAYKGCKKRESSQKI